MTLTALVVLLVVLAVVWRLVRIAVRLILLALIVGAVLWYAGEHTRADRAHDPPAAQSGRVVRVADGDTLTVLTARGRERVRLLGHRRPGEPRAPASGARTAAVARPPRRCGACCRAAPGCG